MLCELSQRLRYAQEEPLPLLLKLEDEFAALDYIGETVRLMREGRMFGDAWKMALADSGGKLDAGDIALLSEVGDVLGQSYLETQLDRLTLISKRLLDRQQAARSDAMQRSRMYATMGVLLGAAAAVVVI